MTFNFFKPRQKKILNPVLLLIILNINDKNMVCWWKTL